MIERRLKPSELGLIPVDWTVVKLSDISDFATAAVSTDRFSPEAYVTTDNMLQDRMGVVPFMGELPYGRVREYRPGDILLSNIRPYLKKIWLSNVNAGCSNDVLVIRPKADFVDSGFLFSQLSRDSFFQYVTDTATGTKMPRGDKGLIKEYLVAIPKYKEEQERISKAFFEIDQLLGDLNRCINKKKMVRQGTLNQLLTGANRLKGFSQKWQEKCIGEIGHTYSGITGKGKADFGHGLCRYITFLNVLNNPYINTDILESVDIDPMSENQNEVRKGDLFFNTSSETPEDVGTCSTLLTDVDNVYLNSFCFGYRLEDEEMSGLFLSYYFRSAIGRKEMTMLAQGATRYNLSKENFNKIVVTVPPTKKEQDRIAGILTAMDKEIAALEAERDKYKNIKQGMMQKLLTGQIRLPV